ncbi:hypothetical protein D9757_008631 [Collybiopsis confluens]|uniref:Uncharacterized protein n=1 Tax=Collybiopsis confluens TaxID=2823264 RepID=A0A8H5M0Q4_9AGAR|nr:hypothetical protein D9757_008631 [Collybiopsis confluens]
MLNPCIATETFSIASVLLVIRVGISVNDAEGPDAQAALQSSPVGRDAETQAITEDHSTIENSQDNQAVQPFRLKYEKTQ